MISTTSFPPDNAGTKIPSTARITLRARAAHNTLIQISSNAPINMDQSDSASFFASSLVPYFALLSLTCCPDRPCIRSSLFISFIIINLLFRILQLFNHGLTVTGFYIKRGTITAPLFIFTQISGRVPQVRDLLCHFLRR